MRGGGASHQCCAPRCASVENLLRFRLVDVVLVDHHHAGVDRLGHLLAAEDVGDGFDAEVAHLVRALHGDRLERAVLHELLQVIVAVEADGHHLAGLAGLHQRPAGADGGRLVGREEALEVRVRSQHVGGLVQRGRHLRLRVEGPDDLQLGVLLDVVLEAADAPDLGAGTGDVRHDRDLAGGADPGDELLGAELAGQPVVGGQERLVVVLAGVGHHRVDQHDGNAGLPGFLEGRDERIRIRGGEHDAGHLAVHRVLDQVHLLGDGRFGSGAGERHGMALDVLDGVLRALVDVLPERRIDGLDDDGDFTGRHGAARQGDGGQTQQAGHDLLHFLSPRG